MLALKFHCLFDGLPPLVPLPTPITPPAFMYCPSNMHTLRHTYAGGRFGLAKEAKPDQRPGVREPGYLVESSCPLLSLPLTPAWQQPEIWRLSRPLSWEKKRDRTAHIDSGKLLSLLSSLTVPRSPRHTKKKESRLSMLIHSFSHKWKSSFRVYTPSANLTKPLNYHMLDFSLLSVC